MIWVRNVIAGALSGVGVVVLLQQFGVAYPTGSVAIIGVVLGIAVQVGVGALLHPRPATVAPTSTARSAASTTVPDVTAAAWDDRGVGSTGTSPWAPTHRVTSTAIDAWGAPDPAAAPVAHLDPDLPVRVIERTGDWARVECANAWQCWVDGRLLEELS